MSVTEQAVRDLHLLGKARGAVTRAGEDEAVGVVFALHPPGAEAERDASARNLVGCGCHARDHGRMAERRRGNERA